MRQVDQTQKTRSSLTAGSGELELTGADLIAEVRTANLLWNRLLSNENQTHRILLDDDALNKLEEDTKAIAGKMKNGSLNSEESRELYRVTGELCKFSVAVICCCSDATQNYRTELHGYLNEGSSLQFESAGVLARLGELQRRASEYFTPIGLSACNLGMIASFGF